MLTTETELPEPIAKWNDCANTLLAELAKEHGDAKTMAINLAKVAGNRCVQKKHASQADRWTKKWA